MNTISQKPRVVGHRGSLYRSLENTRHSLKIAAEHCSDVECDVFLLKCNTLVVFHGSGGDVSPGSLKQYCNMDASILDLTYEETKNLKFNPEHKEFGCGKEFIEEMEHECYIPTLEEVLLDAQETGVIVKIELKGPNTEVPVLHLVERMGMVDRVTFASFKHDRIKRIRELRPHLNDDGTHRYKTGALFSELPENFIDMAKVAGATEIHLKYSTCTKKRVDMIHKAGMRSMTWMRGPIGMRQDIKEKNMGVENEQMYLRLMKTGVMAMCVNRPDVLANLLSRLSKHAVATN